MKCERKMRKKSAFARDSFRTIKHSDGTRVLIGCPKGKWNSKRQRCRVGTRAYAVIKPATGGRCPAKYRRA